MEQFILTILGKAGYDALKALFSSNKSEIDKAFDSALDRAQKWYVEIYGDQYGAKNERFFDYDPAVDELEKLTYYLPDPDVDRISGIELKWGNKVPREVIIKFIGELKKEMAKEQSLDTVFKEREKLFTIHRIADQTAKIADNTGELVDLQRQQLAVIKQLIYKPCSNEKAATGPVYRQHEAGKAEISHSVGKGPETDFHKGIRVFRKCYGRHRQIRWWMAEV